LFNELNNYSVFAAAAASAGVGSTARVTLTPTTIAVGGSNNSIFSNAISLIFMESLISSFSILILFRRVNVQLMLLLLIS